MKVLVVVLALLTVLSSCKKKKPVSLPPAAMAPNIAHTPSLPQPQPLPPPTPPAAPETTPANAGKAKPRPRRHVAMKPTPKPEKKVEVPEEPAPPEQPRGQLAANIPEQEIKQQRQATAQLLQSAENNLRSLRGSLSTDEQAMVQQVKAYIQQSRAADADGDTERAYNLAQKARLLSAELLKNR